MGEVRVFEEKGHPDARKGFMSEKAYREMMMLCIIVCVDVVIIDRRRELFFLAKRIVKPADTFWVLGGRAYAFEDFKDAAVRFLLEDAGIKISRRRVHLVATHRYWWSKVRQVGVGGSDNLAFTYYVDLKKSEREQVVLSEKEYDQSLGLTPIGRGDLKKVSPPIRDLYREIFGR